MCRSIGATLALKVMPKVAMKVPAGDQVDIGVKAWYKAYTGGGLPIKVLGQELLPVLTGTLGGQAAGLSGGKTTPGELGGSSILRDGLQAFLDSHTDNAAENGRPKAYLNWLLLDEQFKYVPEGSGFIKVGSATTAMQMLAMSGLPVVKSGYLFVYLSYNPDHSVGGNETSGRNVFFDNLVVNHYTGAIVEESTYYPFGLVQQGISSRAFGRLRNKEKTFQGQRFDEELALNWVQFKWRNHDVQIGRFIEIDPLAEKYEYNSTYAFSENKVTNHVELEGLEAVTAGSAQGWLNAAFGQITEALGRGVDKVASFFTKSEMEVSKPSPVTNVSTVVTAISTTEYGTNVFGWIQNSKSPNATVSNGPSIFKVENKAEVKVELKQEIKTGSVTLSTKTALNGYSQEVKAEVNTSIKKLPVKIGVSNSQNFETGVDKTKIRVGVGPSTSQVFGQVEVSNQNNNTTTSISIGMERKTGNVKNTISIGKSF